MHNPAIPVTVAAYPPGGCGGMLPQKIQFRHAPPENSFPTLKLCWSLYMYISTTVNYLELLRALELVSQLF